MDLAMGTVWYSPEVVRIDASPVQALVMDYMSLWDRANPMNVSHSVGE
jgi:hypothetical protein